MTQTRRAFLSSVAAAAAAGPLVLARPRAQARKIRHASIGASGMALADIRSFAKHPAFDLVAVADVDLCLVPRVQELFPAVRVYQDWRELLKREQRLDSVNVSTPDHMHAAVAMAAMRRGLHVYVQKPLAATLREVRAMTTLAARRRVVSQMGIQVSSSVPQRLGEAVDRHGGVGVGPDVARFAHLVSGFEQVVGVGELAQHAVQGRGFRNCVVITHGGAPPLCAGARAFRRSKSPAGSG